MKKKHSFHIPVMGIGYTIDTPLKVSHLGMDSVISLVDDILLEKLRKMYSEKFELPYKEITDKINDFRAKRITSYLNLINELVDKKIEGFKTITSDKINELIECLNMLPNSSTLKDEFKKLTASSFNVTDIKNWISNNLRKGSIDVNIMTKVDKDNYKNNEKLPVEYNDAHAAVRGFANSDLNSSLILSAGMNPRLYGFLEEFEDFFPNVDGAIKKKIVLKVSDYRSALIQGKYLAKKGIWISEYRIESGLNCGGHAFATDGYLLGPILEEFKNNREEMAQSIYEILVHALSDKNRTIPKKQLPIKITAQGGVGTAEEHEFLIDNYKVDSVGWGSPFLLVPEATSVDKNTLNKLAEAKEDDLYLSQISPLGVAFNNLKGNTKDVEKTALIKKGRPGSVCTKKYVGLNTEFTDKGICTASRQYQRLKIKELNAENLSKEEYKAKYDKIVEKSCICVGLGTSTLLAYDIETKSEGKGVAVCPGPNMAYFSKQMSLKDMTNHIYGRSNMLSKDYRPNMFIKELNIYLDYLKKQIEEAKSEMTKKQEKYMKRFANNLNEGIQYYDTLFNNMKDKFNDTKFDVLAELESGKKRLQTLEIRIEN
ncbi:MAG: hypothetical protein HKO81_07030 [Flavobacteriaceae bacterium]|nr:hypothetical protein [Flavobacteriaceae bacterium]